MRKIAKYRRKPIHLVVEAVKYGDSSPETLFKLEEFAGDNIYIDRKAVPPIVLVYTPSRATEAKLGEYIYKNENGHFFPCDAGVFEKTYEKVEE